MNDPTFTISIPNYNYGGFIGKTIESILKQSYKNFEIIIADNASTDDSIKVIESFKDDRIKLIKNEYNIGFAPNLQKSTMYSKGDFINLLSSDDLMASNTLETYVDAINNSKLNYDNILLFSDVRFIDFKGNISEKIYKNNHSVLLQKDYKHKFNYGNGVDGFIYDGSFLLSKIIPDLAHLIPFCSAVYSRRLYEKIEGYNAVRTIGPDKFFNYKILSLNPAVIYIKQPLFDYRVHESINLNNLNNSIKPHIDDYLNVIEFSDEILVELGIDRKILINKFLDKVCLKVGLTQLVYGTYVHAVRSLSFAFASFPLYALKRKLTWVLVLLLILGPLGKIIAKPSYLIYRWLYNIES